MTLIKDLLKNIGALFVGIVMALLIAEGCLQVYNPFDSRVRGDRIILPANKKYVIKSSSLYATSPAQAEKFDEVIIHSKNSLGFRGTEPPDDFDGALTVITIGGSTTECTFLSDGKTWTDVLGDKLKSDFDSFWINNAGLDGHTTFGHIVLLKDYVVKLRPDVVLLLVGANDQGAGGAGEYDKEIMQDEVMFDSPKWFIKSMANHSEVFSLAVNLYRYIQARLIGVSHRGLDFGGLEGKGQRIITEEEKEHRENILRSRYEGSLSRFRDRLEIIIKILREHDILPVFITQPTLYGDFIIDPENVKITHGEGSMYLLELYNNVTRTVGNENGILVIDLAAELPRNSKYYYDFYHFTNEGAEKVAAIIYDGLASYLADNYPGHVKD